MLIYHFCSRYHLPSILREGITKGYVLINIEKLLLISGYQWLTINDDFNNQTWSIPTTLPYDRTEFRLTLNIPAQQKKTNLVRWDQISSKLSTDETIKSLNTNRDHENWYLYRGLIPSKWIRSVATKNKSLESSMKERFGLK